MGATADIRVGATRKLTGGDGARFAASVAGEELWFESAEAEQAGATEALASALLPVAVLRGSTLTFEAPLDAVWLHNAAALLAIWNRWWAVPADPRAVVNAPVRNGAADRPGAGRGLCFTLGVDSFHTLLRGGRRLDRLLFAHGFDVGLADTARITAIRDSLEAVTRETGVGSVIVSTNLRRHHLAVGIDWERAHGGALAALGHLHASRLGSLLVSSTKPYFADGPWGSHWNTDPRWSSSRLRIEHVGAELRRNAKLAAIADEPLVQRHLRVCWENRAPAGNCGRCEKCLRTMLILTVEGRLDDFPVFPPTASLASALDAVERMNPDLFPVYETALQSITDRRLRRSVRRLIERSPRPG